MLLGLGKLTCGVQSRRSPLCNPASNRQGREACSDQPIFMSNPSHSTFKTWGLISSYLSVLWVDTGCVNLRDELDSWGAVWVVRSAVDVDTVYAVLVDALK